MSDFNENMKRLAQMQANKYGDNDDTPIKIESIHDLETVCAYCQLHDVPQPQVFPWAGGVGCNAEWIEDDYHIVLSTNGEKVHLCMGKKDPVRAVEFKVTGLHDAVKQVITIFQVLTL